jgi:hypothetical protein
VDNLSNTPTSAPDEQCAPIAAFGPCGGPGPGGPELRRRKPGVSSALPQWPRLQGLGLSITQISDRKQGIGGSDANIILSGSADRVRQLWLEKRGEVEPADLSANLAVMLGCWTEAFNRQWFEQLTSQKVTRLGDTLSCARHSWRRCTLDGFVEDTGAVWEAKHTSAFAKPEEVLERYMSSYSTIWR